MSHNVKEAHRTYTWTLRTEEMVRTEKHMCGTFCLGKHLANTHAFIYSILMKDSGRAGGGQRRREQERITWEGVGLKGGRATLHISTSGCTQRTSLGSHSELCVSAWLVLVQHTGHGVPHGHGQCPYPLPTRTPTPLLGPGLGKES